MFQKWQILTIYRGWRYIEGGETELKVMRKKSGQAKRLLVYGFRHHIEGQQVYRGSTVHVAYTHYDVIDFVVVAKRRGRVA